MCKTLRIVSLFIFLFLVSAPLFATTYYIDSIGGSRFSTLKTAGLCDGTADTAPVGTTPNQHCAFNDIRYLWADGSYSAAKTFPGWGWIISGGDTIIVKSCIQYSAPGVVVPGSSGSCRIGPSGPNTNDYFLGVAGNNGASGMPSIPSGASGAHTIIVGVNFAGCMFSCPSGTTKTEVYGGYGIGSVFSVAGSQYVDIIGFDIDDHAACGQTGISNQCNREPPFDDYSSNGITSNTLTGNITVTDTAIHGLASDGWHGPIGGDVTMNRVYVGYNDNGGINLDNSSGLGSTGGTFTLNQVTIEWNGCIQQYPIVNPIPALICFDQNFGGYGDAIGTPGNDGASFVVEQSVIRYNTQDGVDLLHSFGGTILVERTQIYGNVGQSIKLGSTSSSIVRSNLIINNCWRLNSGYNFPGAPVGFNNTVGPACRAGGDIFAISWGGASNIEEFDNNTVIAGGATLLDITCSASDCSSGIKTLRNNIFIGYAVADYNAEQAPGTFCYNSCNNSTKLTNSAMWTARSNNTYYNFRACPVSTFANETCNNPGITTILGITAPLDNEDFDFDAFVANLPVGSPSIHAGLPITGLTTDFNGKAFANPPSIGALEFFGTTPMIPHISGSFVFSGSARLQ